MEHVGVWAPAVVMLAVGAWLVWREPRRMPPALVLTALLFWLAGHGFLALMALGDRIDDLGSAWVLLGFIGASMVGIVLLGVFLIWNTVEVTRKEGRRLAAIITAAAGVGLLAYVVVAVLAVLLNNGPMVIWLLLLGLPLAYLAFVFTAFLLYSWIYGLLTKRFGGPVDAVIVLGSGLIGGSRVPPLLAARLDLGRDRYETSRQAGRDTILVPSGGRGSDEKIAEADAMGRYLEDLGVDPDHVLREDRSTDTRENLEFSAALLDAAGVTGTVAVATNNFHAFRAATLMRDAGLAGYSIGAPTARYYWPSATVREVIAVVRDNLAINLLMIGAASLPFIILVGSTLAHLVSG